MNYNFVIPNDSLSAASYKRAVERANTFANAIKSGIEAYITYMTDDEINNRSHITQTIPCLCMLASPYSFQVHPVVEFDIDTTTREATNIKIIDFSIPGKYMHVPINTFPSLLKLINHVINKIVNPYFINDGNPRKIQYGQSFPDEY